MRAPGDERNAPLYEYTLMPTHMRARFSVQELQNVALGGPFRFTKGCRVLKIPARRNGWRSVSRFGTLLWDLDSDPAQEQPLVDHAVEQQMIDLLVEQMELSEAPPDQYRRLGLPIP
jgi:hypothetical protein